jgi:NDP-sugar pyrophosphorylase family protein
MSLPLSNSLNRVGVFVLCGGMQERLTNVPMPKCFLNTAMGVPFIECLVVRMLHAGAEFVCLLTSGDPYHSATFSMWRYALKKRLAQSGHSGLAEKVILRKTGGLGTWKDLELASEVVSKSNVQDVLTANGDTAVELDFVELSKALVGDPINPRGDLMMLLTSLRGVPNEGAFGLADDGRVLFSREAYDVEFHRPPPGVRPSSHLSSTGMLIFKRDAFLDLAKSATAGLPPRSSLERELLPEYIHQSFLDATTRRDSYRVTSYNNGPRLFFDFGTDARQHLLDKYGDRVVQFYGGALINLGLVHLSV